jgi:hypothetical protein
VVTNLAVGAPNVLLDSHLSTRVADQESKAIVSTLGRKWATRAKRQQRLLAYTHLEWPSECAAVRRNNLATILRMTFTKLSQE